MSDKKNKKWNNGRMLNGMKGHMPLQWITKKPRQDVGAFFIASSIALIFYNSPTDYSQLFVFKYVFLISVEFERYDLQEMQNLASSLHRETQLY